MTQNPAPATSRVSPDRAKLRKVVGEVVGSIFIAPMLKMARNEALQGKYGHGGRGERVFQAQLDQQLAQLVGGRMQNSLTESICDRLAKGKGV